MSLSHSNLNAPPRSRSSNWLNNLKATAVCCLPMTYLLTNISIFSFAGPGTTEPCEQGKIDAKNHSPMDPKYVEYSENVWKGDIGIHGSWLTTPVVIGSSALVAHGTRMISRSATWSESLKGLGYLFSGVAASAATLCLVILGSEPWLQELNQGIKYAHAYDNTIRNQTFSCDTFSLPPAYFKGFNIASTALASCALFASARYGYVKGQADRQAPPPEAVPEIEVQLLAP